MNVKHLLELQFEFEFELEIWIHDYESAISAFP